MGTYEDTLLRKLEERGVTVGPDRNFMRLPGFADVGLLTDEQLRYLNERQGDHDVEAGQKSQWVGNLASVCTTLDAQGKAAPWPFMSVFWTRLHGLIAELREETAASFRNAGVDPETVNVHPGSLLALQVAKFRAIEAVRTRLTDDELIYADYRRQTEGHPTQGSYSVRWGKGNGGQVLDRRGIPALDRREFTVAELTEAIRRILHDHAGDEEAVEVAFARKIAPAMGPLVQIFQRLATPG